MKIGLGDIGGNLAAWLAGQGHAATGYDIDPEAMARAAARGVTPAGSTPELAENAEVIATSLADIEAVRATYCAEAGLIALAGRDTVTVEAMRKGAGAGATVVLDRHGAVPGRGRAKHQALQPDRQEGCPGAG